MSREDTIRQLLQQRRQLQNQDVGAANNSAAHASRGPSQQGSKERVQQLLLQRRGKAPEAFAESGMARHHGADPQIDELLSPTTSSTSTERDPTLASVKQAMAYAQAPLQRATPSKAILRPGADVKSGGGTPAAGRRSPAPRQQQQQASPAMNSMQEEEARLRRELAMLEAQLAEHGVEPEHGGDSMGAMALMIPSGPAGHTDQGSSGAEGSSAGAQARGAGISASERRSLAQLENMLAAAMNQISLESNPAFGGTDGPFDISELWAGQASTHSISGTPSSGISGTQGMSSGLQQEATSSQQPRQRGGMAHGAAHQVGRGATARAKQAAAAATAAMQRRPRSAVVPASPGRPKPAPAAAVPTPGRAGAAARPRPASAPRMRGGSGAGGAAATGREAGSMHAPPAGQALLLTGKVGGPGGPGVDFTFQPQINESSKEMIKLSYPQSREERIAQLSVPKSILLQKYELVRKEVEDAELQECTFKPKTGRPPSPARVRPNVPVYDRLYQAKPNWEQKRDDLLREREEKAMQECTFQPTVNKSRPSSPAPGSARAGNPYVPIHMRVADVLRSRSESLSNARIRMELANEGVTFKPSVNPKSLRLALEAEAKEGLAGVSDVGERLYKRHEVKQQRKAADTSGADQECTFAPAINDKSRVLLARSMELPSSFLERQQYMAALAAEKKALYRDLVEQAECSFTPAVLGGTGRQRAASVSRAESARGSWASDSAGSDRIAKLAYQDVRHSQALKDALADHYYSQFSFTPRINERSRAMGRTHSVEDLYRNDLGKHVKERVAAAVTEHELEQCSFKPALNPTSLKLAEMRRSRGQGGLLDSVNVDNLAKLRAARLQEVRAQKEYEELRECTFTPEVNKSMPDFSKAPSNVPGMSRYMELQVMAKQKKEAEKKRQEEVWWQNPKGSNKLYTVPKPFGFEAREQERLALEQQRAAAEEHAQLQLQYQQQQQQQRGRQQPRGGQQGADGAAQVRNRIQQILQQAEPMLGVGHTTHHVRPTSAR